MKWKLTYQQLADRFTESWILDSEEECLRLAAFQVLERQVSRSSYWRAEVLWTIQAAKEGRYNKLIRKNGGGDETWYWEKISTKKIHVPTDAEIQEKADQTLKEWNEYQVEQEKEGME